MDNLKDAAGISEGKTLLENRKYDEALVWFTQQAANQPDTDGKYMPLWAGLIL